MTQPVRYAHDHYASGQPTRAQLEDLAARGVKTVINLRGSDEPTEFDEAAEVQKLGMRYQALPITGAVDLDRDRVHRFGALLDQAQLEGAVLIHCASANRVGAMVALDQMFNRGAGRSDAVALGRAAGLEGLEPAVEEIADREGIV